MIRELFSQFWFRIPAYQRAYVWEKDEITELLDDINYASKHNSDGDYFLGSMVLCKGTRKDNVIFDEYEVLDGQQRLTTLMLILACIRDHTDDETLKNTCCAMLYQEENEWEHIPGRNRLFYDIRDKVEEFIKMFIINVGGTKSAELTEYETSKNMSLANMAKGIKTIGEYFDSKCSTDINFECFVKYFLNNTLFIYVATEDFDDAFRLFTILNNRGMPLSSSDILKAKNLGALTDDRERAKWAEYWEEVEGDMGRDEFDRFLSLVRTIYVKDKTREGLLKEFDSRIYGANPPLLELGKKTFEAVKEFKEAFDALIQLDDLPASLGNAYRNRINVMRKGLPSTDWIPPVLAWYHKFKTDSLQDLLRLIENKFSADWITQVTPTRRINNMNAVLKNIDLARSPDVVLTSNVFEFDHKRLLELLDDNIYGRPFAKYVLLRLEYLQASHAAPLNLPDEISIEHILPQNPNANSQWIADFNENQREYWLHRLGNLMLLSRRKNASLGNLDFSGKRDSYFSTRVENLPNSVGVLKLENFKFKELKSRHKDLIDKLATSYNRLI